MCITGTMWFSDCIKENKTKTHKKTMDFSGVFEGFIQSQSLYVFQLHSKNGWVVFFGQSLSFKLIPTLANTDLFFLRNR